MGYSAESSSPSLSDHIQSDASFIQFIENSTGTDWYGIYIQEGKVGYLKSISGRENGPNGTIYKIQQSGTVQIPLKTETDEMKIDMVAEFETQRPFSMICLSEKIIHQNDISETKITWTPKGYKASIIQGGETHTHMIGGFEYSLKDYAAVQRWIIQDPKEGAEIKYPYLNLETLTLEEKTSRITGIHKTIISGVKTSYYDVVTIGSDGLEIQEKFGADGKPYRIVLGGVFECRLEPKSLAIHMDATVDFLVKNRVPVNQCLGDPETVTLLKLLIDKNSGALLKNASGQSVTREPADNSFMVTVNSKGIPCVNATEEEIKKNLAATVDIPANHPAVIGLAHDAIGDAGTTSEKLSRLVKFVYDYIEDDYTVNPLTVLDIIVKKKGDCSEHAKLLTAMARAMGIPCRTVGGLVYLGDEFQEFGLHAWNEVVVDGMWVSVDPTWGQTLVDATHIRFPMDKFEEWQIMAEIPNMKIEVLHVEHKK